MSLPLLSDAFLESGSVADGALLPTPDYQYLPEKVIQFGTGVLLRGLPDFLIDKANRQQRYNGRIVQVKSTSQGNTSDFSAQNNLFTLVERGVENGQMVDRRSIVSSVSRTLDAQSEWEAVLALALQPEIEVVISNTTEVGISLVSEIVTKACPESFPGKLTAILYHRFKAFGKEKGRGFCIIPCELLQDNGTKLKQIVHQLAALNELGKDFENWLNDENTFCNSLVDRIVPGKPSEIEKGRLEEETGFEDKLLTIAEPYRLWAIEFPKGRKKPDWSEIDPNWILDEDISIYRERKLRLLNGSHTFVVGLAHLAGFVTVNQAMENPVFSQFVTHLAFEEIAPATLVPQQVAHDFAKDVLDRFRNPFIAHFWLSISLQYSTKMKMRNIPTLKQFISNFGILPERMTLGFAAMIYFCKAERVENETFFGNANGSFYPIQDDNAAFFYKVWQEFGLDFMKVSEFVLRNTNLWGEDLSNISGLVENVAGNLSMLSKASVMQILEASNAQKDV